MASEEHSDSVLFRQVKAGSNRALEELFAKYYPALCVFAASYVNSSVIAEDLVSETFANFWVKRKKIEIKQQLKAYLYTSVKNAALVHLRKKRFQTVEISTLHTVRANCSPTDGMQTEDAQKSIANVLDKIPKQSRKVFLMHRLDELKYKEIAAILDISVKTVENHMGKAIKILKENHSILMNLIKTVIALYLGFK